MIRAEAVVVESGVVVPELDMEQQAPFKFAACPSCKVGLEDRRRAERAVGVAFLDDAAGGHHRDRIHGVVERVEVFVQRSSVTSLAQDHLPAALSAPGVSAVWVGVVVEVFLHAAPLAVVVVVADVGVCSGVGGGASRQAVVGVAGDGGAC